MTKRNAFLMSVAAGALAAAFVPAHVGAEGAVVAVPMADARTHHDPRVRESGMRESTSTNWSGYGVETNLSAPQSDAVTDVIGTWTVPAASASTSAKTYSSNWVGIDGYSSKTVEQIGTESDWSNGSPVYYAWFEMYPKRGYLLTGFDVSPGDSITAEVKYQGSGKFLLSITNNTTGQSYSTTQKLNNAARSSAEWIVEAPSNGGVLPLANFGTTSFTSCSATINGHTGSIGDTAWQYDALDMVTSGGTTKASTSALKSRGAAFSVTWLHE